MRITLAQLNYHVGNLERNSELMMEAIAKAENDGSDIVVFSELSLCGYPPLDLLEHSDFIYKCQEYLDIIAGRCRKVSAIVGAPAINTNSRGKKLFNAAYVLADGKILDRVDKGLLPTYDIYDEYRYFEPANEFKIIELKGKRIALTICEDLWDEQSFDNAFSSPRLYRISPMDELIKYDPDLLINISASPFAHNKTESRRKIFTDKAARYKLPLFMVNQVGANTDLIFDGSSLIVGPGGKLLDIFPPFKEHLASYELSDVINGKEEEKRAEDSIGMMHSALVFGLEDYFRKMNFSSAVIGLSGGIDSAVCLCIAAEALGHENVKAILLPSMHSSKHSVDDAVELAGRLGVEYEIINIEKAYMAITGSLSETMKDMPEDITEENIQARLRSLLLMAISNKFGHILLNTSNKSESAVGYSTLYGDMAGSLSVLGDVYKTDIYRLAEHINRKEEVIPLNIIKKAPSAELRPGQKDSDSLPTYDILDSILYQYIELQKAIVDIEGQGFDAQLVKKVTDLVNQSEFKRYQAPPILRVSSKSFGPGRRMPLVGKY